MAEDPDIIRANIARYREMLMRELDEEKRAAVKRLLAEALEDLTPQRDSKK